MRSRVISYSYRNNDRLEAGLILPVAPAQNTSLQEQAPRAGPQRCRGKRRGQRRGRGRGRGGSPTAGQESVPERESASAPSPPSQTPQDGNTDTLEEFLFNFRRIKMHK